MGAFGQKCLKCLMYKTSFSKAVALVFLWHFIHSATTSLIFSGRLPHLQSSEEAGRKSLTCGVIGGIEGQSFENEGCMMRELKRLAAEQEILAEKSGLNLAPELHKLETSNDFVKFASKHGADVKKKGTTYWKVKKGNVWWVFSTSKQKFKKKEVKHVIITALKAMGIAFGKKWR